MKNCNKTLVTSHFTEPQWQVVNKIRAITTCQRVSNKHCSTQERLFQVFSETEPGTDVLFFTDDLHFELIQKIEQNFPKLKLSTVIFLSSKLTGQANLWNGLASVNYFLGTPIDQLIGRDISILIRKFCFKDILDLSKYLSYGAHLFCTKVLCKKTKSDAIEEVFSFVESLGSAEYQHPFGEYAVKASEVLDELLINSIFHANPRYEDKVRSIPFQLKPEETILVEWGYDGDYFGLSVRDPFGGLDRETALNYMGNTDKERDVTVSSSGGMGLRSIVDKTHQLIANVHQNKVTEVICLMKFETRLQNFHQIEKTFHYFHTD